MTLISGSGEPLYLQLKRNIRDLILRELKPGDRVPSETEICEQYSISRAVVRQAMTSLEFEGYVNKVQGRGTFVADGPLRHDSVRKPWPADRSLSSYRLISLDIIDADEHISIPLGFEQSTTRVVRVRLVASVGSVPMYYHVLYVSSDLAREGLAMVECASAIEMFEQMTGEQVLNIEHTITAVRNDPFRASLLSLSVGVPLLLDQGIYNSAKGRGRGLERTFISPAQSAVVFEENLNTK